MTLKVRTRHGSTEIDDTPGLHWLHAALFIGVGGLFFLGPIFLFPDADRIRWWLRVLISLVGGIGVWVGIWLLSRSPRSRITVGGGPTAVSLQRWGIGGHDTFEWPLERLAAVQIAERRDDEGIPVFQLQLVLREGGCIPMSPIWHHGREAISHAARELGAACDLRVVNDES